MTVDPNNVAGDGIIKVQVYDPLDSLNVNALIIFSIHVSENNSINENKEMISLFLFPNPASSFISIQTSSNSFINSINVFDLAGRMVAEYFFDRSSACEKINIENLYPGKYFIELFTTDKKDSFQLS